MQDKIYDAVDVMMHTDRLHKSLFDLLLDDLPLHRHQFIVLKHLTDNKYLSQKQLAEHLRVSPASMAVTLKKLEAQGYIERKSGKDSRFNEILITKKGVDTLNECKNAFEQIDVRLFSDFSDEELDGYIRYLNKIKSNILKIKEEKNNGKMV